MAEGLNEAQERALKRVNEKLGTMSEALAKEQERELQMSVDNAERRERQIVREYVRGQYRKHKAYAKAADEVGSDLVSADHEVAARAYSNVLAFLAGREKKLNEKRSRQLLIAGTRRKR